MNFKSFQVLTFLLGASVNSNRDESAMRVAQWSELKTASDRSYHSGQSASGSTRDSGAGDSVESEFGLETDLPLIYHRKQPVPVELPDFKSVKTLPKKPTFTTFMGDSDAESVQIVDYTKDLKL